jgi:hypothetical protein
MAEDQDPADVKLVDGVPKPLSTDDLAQLAADAAAIANAPPPVWYVARLTIVDRLEAAGLGDASDAALAANRPRKRRWEAAVLIPSDNADVRAFLAGLGADPDVILAPDGSL